MKRIILPALFCGILIFAGCLDKDTGQEEVQIPIMEEAPETTALEFPTINIDTSPDYHADYYLKKGLPPRKEPSRMKRILLQQADAFEKELAYFNGPCLSELDNNWDSLVKHPLVFARRPFKPHGTVTNKRLFEDFSAKEKVGFFIGNPEEEFQNCIRSLPMFGKLEGIFPWFVADTRGVRYSYRQYLAVKRDSVAAVKAINTYLDSASSISPHLLRLIVRLDFNSTFPHLARIYKSQAEPDDLILSAMMDKFNCHCEIIEDCCLSKGLEKKLTLDKYGYIENSPENVEAILKFALSQAKKQKNGKNN